MNLENREMELKRIRKADEILLGFFNINRYPLRNEKRKMAELADVTLQYVINFFYHTRVVAKKIEKVTGRKHIYRLKHNSLDIEPIDGMFISSELGRNARFFHFGSQNSLFQRMQTSNKKKEPDPMPVDKENEFFDFL